MTDVLDIARDIARRIVIEGELVLVTPASFGNGDRDAFTDLPVLLDEASGKALLPGTSLAGALRAWLTRTAQGQGDEQTKATIRLFGGKRAEEGGCQSTLIVDDALGPPPHIDLRDGVAIDPAWRTASEGAKFDYQLLSPGTHFDLRLELLLPDQDDPAGRHALGLALAALGSGAIRLGLRKQRGFGHCRVDDWRVTTYDLRRPHELLAWLAADHTGWVKQAPAPQTSTENDIVALLAPDGTLPTPVSHDLTVTATFALDTSLLVRSGFGSKDTDPDLVHLHARSADGSDQRVPVLPGTSVAGALRARSRRILDTLLAGQPKNERKTTIDHWIDDLFGCMPAQDVGQEKQLPQASRIRVDETVIEHGAVVVQNRIRIDRFTGGAYESALFNEAPVFGQPDTQVELHLAVRPGPAEQAARREAEVGLVLLLLKDLWTGDLPLGGESSVGRGRLRGLKAEIACDGHHWTLAQPDPQGPLTVEPDAQSLNDYVKSLHAALGKEVGQ